MFVLSFLFLLTSTCRILVLYHFSLHIKSLHQVLSRSWQLQPISPSCLHASRGHRSTTSYLYSLCASVWPPNNFASLLCHGRLPDLLLLWFCSLFFSRHCHHLSPITITPCHHITQCFLLHILTSLGSQPLISLKISSQLSCLVSLALLLKPWHLIIVLLVLMASF